MKILVVDDDRDLLLWEATILTGAGHTVASAASAAEALVLLDSFQPDLLLLDILMPGMGGFDVIGEVRRRAPALPVVIVSVLQAVGESLLRGASDFLAKPLDPVRVLETVTRILQAAGEVEGARVLVVEDDEVTAGLYRTVLERRFRPLVALNGFEALQVLRETPDVRLVITDIHMPGMDGLELIRALRADERWKSLPVIVQTSDRDLLKSDVFEGLGVEQVLDKDGFTKWLLARIRKARPT